MCERFEDNSLISIEEKTKEFKYEFLSSYITKWNAIVGRYRINRAIIDTHAGTGKVLLNNKEEIYGSSLLFLKKTALLQDKLFFYFLEQDKKNYNSLNNHINKVCNEGFRFPSKYTTRLVRVEKNGLFFEKKKKNIKYEAKTIYPDLRKINIINGNCVNLIEKILKEIIAFPSFFFIDPCGALEWDLLKKIINSRLDKPYKEGTDLFINFSWQAILRNKSEKFPEKQRNNFFKKIFNIDLNEVNYKIKIIEKKKKKLGKRYTEYDLYLELFKNKLEKYFSFVSQLDIPGIWTLDNPVYSLIFCTNNESAKSLYESIEKRLTKTKKEYRLFRKLDPNITYQKMREFRKEYMPLDKFKV